MSNAVLFLQKAEKNKRPWKEDNDLRRGPWGQNARMLLVFGLV